MEENYVENQYWKEMYQNANRVCLNSEIMGGFYIIFLISKCSKLN